MATDVFPKDIYVMNSISTGQKKKIQLEAYPDWEEGTEDGDEIAVYQLVKVCRVKVISEKRLEAI